MMQLNCNVNAEDLEKSQAYILKNFLSQKPFGLEFLLSFTFYFCICYFGYFPNITPTDTSYYLMISSVFLALGGGILYQIWKSGGILTKWYQSLSGMYLWEINAAGISISIHNPQMEIRQTFYPWSEVLALTDNEDAWYFYVHKNIAICIPKRASFTGGRYDIYIQASQYWSAHPDNYGMRLPTLPPSLYSTQKALICGLFKNIKYGLKNALFLKVKGLEFKSNISQLLAICLLDGIVIAIFDYARFYPNSIFNVYGVTQHASSLLLFSLACIAVVSLIAAKTWAIRLNTILVSSMLLPSIIYLAILQAFSIRSTSILWGLWGAFMFWLLLIMYRTLRNLFGLPTPTIISLLGIFTFIAFWAAELYPDQQIFIENYQEDNYQESKVDEETLYYQQPKLIENALARIAPHRTDKTDMYFLGFAGYGYQKVFSSEVKFAKNLFDTKFDTKQRSALLITHESTLENFPLANKHNLDSMLKGIAQKIDVEEDILFLFLSSHGSKKFELSISLYPLDMKDLPAKDIKKMLDNAGIKNRVIVVSACYSGGFIDVLKDENTLILTAARKDRTSFGCSDDADFTYFGQAYFVDSLQKGLSFTEAFENAKLLIASREKVEQFSDKPSLPQMYEGKAIKLKLDSWASSLHQ